MAVFIPVSMCDVCGVFGCSVTLRHASFVKRVGPRSGGRQASVVQGACVGSTTTPGSHFTLFPSCFLSPSVKTTSLRRCLTTVSTVRTSYSVGSRLPRVSDPSSLFCLFLSLFHYLKLSGGRHLKLSGGR